MDSAYDGNLLYLYSITAQVDVHKDFFKVTDSGGLGNSACLDTVKKNQDCFKFGLLHGAPVFKLTAQGQFTFVV
jgi:hypothetical protein